MESAQNQKLHFDRAWLPGGWAKGVELEVDASGDIVGVARVDRVDPGLRAGGTVLPGMPNLHSHAFQRAMAGLAEHAAQADDSFWTWRETMYRFAGALDPDGVQAIAAQLHVDLLRHGYTAVCEFHYLHHGPDGHAYRPATAMSDALVAAAGESGIGMTLLPALYMTGGLDGRALAARQRRFRHDVDGFTALVRTLRTRESPQLAVGIALHSLRAVPADAMAALLDDAIAEHGPVHVHIAEQVAEVEDCRRARGARPVEWLLDNADVDPRWCLVHATHVTRGELRGIAKAGAVAGLCPTTEANLGDGLFPLQRFLELGGAFGIGSDSHVGVSPLEELRWLEYGQRLASLRRNIACSARETSVGATLFRDALVGGAQASGRRIGALAPGHRADLVVVDDALPAFAGKPESRLLDTLVFAGNDNPVRDVMVGGEWVVRDGRHRDQDRIAARYARAVSALA
ncbi:MAG TPA: formimidoylglutamate deiminase [Xanthomonadales bacterium]|nr:formimidoylglutamate deiminase [Xanthomonadales bacterium]